MGARNLSNQPLALESAQVVGCLPGGIRQLEKGTRPLYELAVVKASDQIVESHNGGEDRHHALFAAAKSGRIKTVVRRGRSGHLTKGGHVGGALRVCRFGVTQTPVGRLTNGSKGIPVLRTDAASDVEVTGVTDDRLGPERSSLFEILL